LAQRKKLKIRRFKMGNAVEKLPRVTNAAHAGSYIRPAVVIKAAAGKSFLVRLRLEDRIYSIPARLAMAGRVSIAPGAQVLVAGADLEKAYIIGTLETTEIEEPARQQVVSPSGAFAQVVSTQGEERIQVRDTARRLIFEYDPVAGKSSLSTPQGDLELLAPGGDIRLRAGKRVNIHGDDCLDLASGHTVRLTAAGDADSRRSSLRLDLSGTTLTGRRLGVTAAAGDFDIDTTTFRGRKLTAAWENAKLVLGKMETVAVRLLERSKNSYRIVENLNEVKAGRMRTLIRNAFHLQSRNASVLAKEDVRIDANRINLG
jgi:hypothetical protein